MRAVNVYAFVIWDRERGGNVRPPRLATLKAIKRVHGVAVDGTSRSVHQSELDGSQFYPRKSNVRLDGQDLLKLRAFQSAYERNVGHPLPRDIERFIGARGLAVRLTSERRGGAKTMSGATDAESILERGRNTTSAARIGGPAGHRKARPATTNETRPEGGASSSLKWVGG